jgi:subtilisin family serine protease
MMRRLRFGVVAGLGVLATGVSLVACLGAGEGEGGGGRGAGPAPGPRGAEPLGIASSALLAAIAPEVTQQVEQTGAARVLVNLRLPDAAGLPAARGGLLARLGGELQLTHAFERVPAVAGVVSAAGLRLLVSDPAVASVQIDEPSAGHLAESVPLLGADVVTASYGYKGKGIRVAVLDTGVDLAHPDLGADVFAQQCFTTYACPPNHTTQGTSAQDDHGHGTNVSGIITAEGLISHAGFAPAAKIAAVKVLDAGSSGFVSDWVAGLDWVLSNLGTLQVRVINTSLGTNALYQGNCDAAQPAVASVLGQLAAQGVTVFASTGNAGSASSVSSPACNTGVIAVGATYDSSQGRQPPSGTFQTLFGGNFAACFNPVTTTSTIACFTNSSPSMALVAPGASLTAPGLGGGLSTFTGTSQASPTAAAIAALLLECNPALTPAGIEGILQQSGTLLTDPKNNLSFRSIQALAAITLGCPCAGKADGTACDDGNPCSQGDTCQSGVCAGGGPVACAPLDQCHLAGTCSPATGSCDNPARVDGAACNDGNACTQLDACQAGACVGGSPVTCTALDPCHFPGTCQIATGLCSNPAKPDGLPCDDGDACTQFDGCQSGACVGGAPVSCPALDSCHLPGTCDPVKGTCSAIQKPDGAPCDDGDPCTTGEVCQAGVCLTGSPVSCAALDPCHVPGTCDPAQGGCSNPASPDGAPCDDGDACTQTDACQAGVCVGADPVSCGPLLACRVPGTCDPATGLCESPTDVDGVPCDDGDACTQGDECSSGTCVGGSPVICPAPDRCHVAGACNPSSGLCDSPAQPDGTPCDLGSCAGGECVLAVGAPPGGCGCVAAGAPGADLDWVLGGPLLALALRRRRQRRACA